MADISQRNKEVDILGICPHHGCGGQIIRSRTGSLLNSAKPYCDICGTQFEFVPEKCKKMVHQSG